MKTIGDIVKFWRKFGKICFRDWSDDTMARYLMFHVEHNCVFTVEDKGEIAGCAVVRQLNECDLEKPWIKNNPIGDSLFVEQMAVSDPKVLPVVLSLACARFPNFGKLKLWAKRRGKLIQLKPESLHKYYYKLYASRIHI